MLLLTVIGPLIVSANLSWKCFPKAMMAQFRHGWIGFTLWDIIMPMFIFMCGAAIPFALGRRLKEGRAVFWKHVLWRVVFLWVMGGLVQGNWAKLDIQIFTPFSNTLQSIAAGYLAVAVVMSFGSRLLAIVVPIVMAIVYTAILAYGGYDEFGNLAYKFDHLILDSILPATNKYVAKPSHYSWFLTMLMFGVMSFAGYHATGILTSSLSKWRKAAAMFVYGVALLAVGLVSEIWIPCIKPIFTLSFTAQAMGWCAVSLGVLYVINDIWMIRKGFSLILLFGQFALTAYFVSHFFAPVLVALGHVVGDGIVAHLPESASTFVNKLLFVIGMIVVMVLWRRIKAR